MIVRKLVTPTGRTEPWIDPTLDEPAVLEIGPMMGAVHGVLLDLQGSGPSLKITQYRIGERDWRFRIEEVAPATGDGDGR